MALAVITAFAVLFNGSFVWPQAVRLVRSGELAGVSPGTWTLALVMFAMWSVYPAVVGIWTLAAANTSCFIAVSILLFAGTRAGWPRKWALMGVGGVVVGVLLALFLPVVLVVVMSVVTFLQKLPQLRMAFVAPSVRGVSMTTWLLGFCAGCCWLVVTISEQAWGVVIASLCGQVVTVTLIVVLVVRKLQERGALQAATTS